MSREKVALKVNNIGHSITHKNSYTVVLAEIGGPRFIPLVVGAFEAQAIAVALENMKPTRPLTHDLVKNIFDVCEIQLQQVIMTSQSEGVFYSSLICKHNDKIVTLDSRTSDALALALRFGCPIFTYEDLLQEVGINSTEAMKKEVDTIEGKPEKSKTSPAKASREEVEKKLQKALDDEDYELAAKLRDELSSLE
ncbi:MAG: bifunctional nuclease family protein [Bacteroidetes bacterium]|nr:bifunctional nuclease family protein [Bacteroidota bacterium]